MLGWQQVVSESVHGTGHGNILEIARNSNEKKSFRSFGGVVADSEILIWSPRTYILGEPLTVVRGERDLDSVVDVGPLGMVVHLLGEQSRSGQEGPCLREIGKEEGLVNGVSVGDLRTKWCDECMND